MQLEDHELEVWGGCVQKGWKLRAEAEQLCMFVGNAQGSEENRK